MHQPEGKHPKQDFQVERIAFFSDAVFAIALTILVLEFRPPVITKTTTSAELWAQFGDMKLKFAAFLFSFFLIINYWTRHHTLFKHVHNYNKQIVNRNMIILLPIIFFPFTTSFFYESMNAESSLLEIPVQIFVLNNVIAGVTMYYFYWTVMKKYKQFSYPMEYEESIEFEEKLLITTVAFAAVFGLSFVTFEFCFWGMAILPLFSIYKKIFGKKPTTQTTNPHHHVHTKAE